MRLLGRDAELAKLNAILADFGSITEKLVLISGERGSGKSALLERFAADAAKRGFQCFRGRCRRGAPGVSHSVWKLIAETIQESRKDQSEEHATGKKLVVTGALESEKWSDSIADAERIGEVPIADLRAALLRLTSSAPVFIALDDLQYADSVSLAFLSSLADFPTFSQILVATTYSGQGLADAPTSTALRKLAQLAHVIELAPLSAAVVGEYVRERVGAIPDEVARKLSSLTGGNIKLLVASDPLFATTQQVLAPAPGQVRVPHAVAIIVDECLESMTAESKDLLSCASVLGKEFHFDHAAQLVGADHSQAVKSLAELERENIVRVCADRGYEFTKGFVREIVYQAIPAERRASLHRRAAVILHSCCPDEIEAAAEPIAYNLLRGSTPTEWGEAIQYTKMAVSCLTRRGALERASELVQLVREKVEGTPYRDDPAIYEIVLALGTAQRDAGDLPAAEQTFVEAARRVQKLSGCEGLIRLVLELPDYHWPLPGSSNPLAIVLAENALRMAGGAHTGIHAMLIARLAAELSYDCDQLVRTRELANRALELVQGPNADGRIKLQVLRYRDCIMRHPDDLQDRLSNLDQVIHLAKQYGEFTILWEASLAAICSLASISRNDKVERLIPVFEKAADLVERPLYRALTVLCHASIASTRNLTGDSEKVFSEFREVCQATRTGWIVNRCWPALLVAFDERGRLAELQGMAAAAKEDRPEEVAQRAFNCWLNARLSHHFAARMDLALIAVNDFASLKHCGDFLAAAVLLAETCAELPGEEDHAKRLYQLLLPYQEREIVLGQIAVLGPTAYYLGRLAVLISDRESARRHLRKAMGLQPRSSWVNLYASFELAVLLSEEKDPLAHVEANKLFEYVRAEAIRHSMSELLQKLEKVMRFRTEPASIGDFSSDAVRPVLTDNSAANRRDAQAVTVRLLPSAQYEGTFRREDEFWLLGFQGHFFRVRHRKGLLVISGLLQKPHELIHVFELSGLVTESATDGGLVAPLASDAAPVLDAKAKRAYRDRANELREELEEARNFNDLGRIAVLENEFQALTRELANALRVFGRDRFLGSFQERARLRIRSAIKYAISGIDASFPPLASHLRSNIKTGLYCAYRPNPILDWDV